MAKTIVHVKNVQQDLFELEKRIDKLEQLKFPDMGTEDDDGKINFTIQLHPSNEKWQKDMTVHLDEGLNDRKFKLRLRFLDTKRVYGAILSKEWHDIISARIAAVELRAKKILDPHPSPNDCLPNDP